MNLVELLALGALGLGRAAREAWRPACWRPWLPVLVIRLLVVLALGFAAHPALAWFMAPLLRAVSGDAALRFPAGLQRLALLAAHADVLVAALVVPVAAGLASRRFAAAFGSPAAAPRSAAGRTLALVVASLPAVLVSVAAQLAVERLAGVRLSAISRLMLPQLAALVVLMTQAACFYVVAEVAVGGASGPGAIAAIPRAFGHGAVPALVALVVLSLPLVPFPRIETAASGGRWLAMPELALLVELARVCLSTALAVLGCGAATLVWLGVIAPQEEPS